MNPLPLALASLRRFPFLSLATVLLVALAVGLGTAVALLEPSLRQGSAAAARKFDLLVGAPGSESQLVLSAVYLDPAPLPLLDGAVAAKIAADPGVAWSSPLLLGDSWNGCPVVGVDAAFLEGAARFAAPTDAVAGALTPLRPGDAFQSMHGRGEHAGLTPPHPHSTVFTVRAVLPPTGTPWDKAILVPAAAVRALHAHGHDAHAQEGGHDAEAAAHGKNPAHGSAHADGEEREETEEHAPTAHGHGVAQNGDAGPTPALVVKPRTVADAYRLRAQYRTAQSLAVFPAEVLVRLYGLLGNAQRVLSLVSGLTQGAVLAGVLLAVFAGLPRRRKTIAVLRALGAPRLYGVLALWLEVFLQLLLGGLLGLALGWGGTFWGLRLLAAHTGVAAQVSLEGAALVSLGLCLAAGSLAALLPAWSCGRAPVARTLRE